MLVVGVVGGRRVRGGQRLVGVMGLEDFRGRGPGVEGAAAGGLGGRLGPFIAGALGQLAAVERDGRARGG